MAASAAASSSFAQANMMADLQLLSVGAAEASPTCLVITDRDRFMVNVGEGTQRLGMEHRVRLTRLFEHIFLTALTPECFGGLPGMLLTLADCGKTSVTIHGPPGTRQLLRSTTHFMRREELKITVREYSAAGPATQGAMLAMHALPLRPAGPTTATAAASAEEEAAGVDDANGEPPAAKRARPSSPPAAVGTGRGGMPVLAWVGRTADVLGKFDVARAKALGIPPGPVYGQLKAGKPATLPDGRTIQPSEVVGASSPGAVFGFVQCPDDDDENDPARILPPPSAWLGALGLSSAQEEAASGEARHVNCLVHYTAAATARTPGYRRWMASFGPKTTHILAALPLGTHRSPFRAARLNNLRLHGLDPAIFPRAPGFTPLSASALAAGVEGADGGGAVVWGENLMKYRLAPRAKEGLDVGGVLGDVTPEDEAELRREAAERQVALALPDAAGGASSTDPDAPSPPSAAVAPASEGHNMNTNDDVEVVFLGTGSAIPSKYRNVSGIYLRLCGGGSIGGHIGGGGNRGMLLDCGEGSLGQLASLYEGDELCEVLLGIRAIWVSHPHADHHLGLMRILVARQEAARRLASAASASSASGGNGCNGVGIAAPPVLVLAPRPVLAWLREFRRVDAEATWAVGGVGEEENDPYLVDVERMTPAAFSFLKAELGVRNLLNVRVDHCPFAYAAVIDAVAGWRLVYSGDTRPCERLVQAGQGATVLIHEATFEAGKAQEAVERRHSTVDEALDVARRMGAGTVLLTHFSQRYPKFPVLPADSELRVCVAFDLMRAHFRDLPRAALLLPALQRLFPAEEEEAAGVGVGMAS